MKRATLWLSSMAIVALIAGVHAQIWDETVNGGGDAGDLPSTAQVVLGNPAQPLQMITGAIDDDVDMYAIFITDPDNFYALTGTELETTFDSKLTLYDYLGRPLWRNDDRAVDLFDDKTIDPLRSLIAAGLSADTYRSSDTPGTPGSATWSLPGSGLYYLAISHWRRNPRNAAGEDLWWRRSPFSAIYAPYAARANDPVAQWGGSFDTGTYTIWLRGASFVPEPASMMALGAGLVGLLGLRRRKK